jgi:hypothetical protein
VGLKPYFQHILIYITNMNADNIRVPKKGIHLRGLD